MTSWPRARAPRISGSRKWRSEKSTLVTSMIFKKEGCSFLKKRTKKLLLPGLLGPSQFWPRTPMRKSFLLLFSKKEGLSF
jgi:hypothetical protein